eukprot:CAMPEP_0179920240 /NCGR_PEP_ID=MMETSP0983-20121128/4369_1 /TAXON_ID=483367 /ORGANISM="non described non described, Strain CCMP 2436" /LENGTH=55 /DNA_ID=CAMNT_0021823245 /DNA_START=33 /DNA_END=196 /DNA_ORIENTATION=+
MLNTLCNPQILVAGDATDGRNDGERTAVVLLAIVIANIAATQREGQQRAVGCEAG